MADARGEVTLLPGEFKGRNPDSRKLVRSDCIAYPGDYAGILPLIPGSCALSACMAQEPYGYPRL